MIQIASIFRFYARYTTTNSIIRVNETLFTFSLNNSLINNWLMWLQHTSAFYKIHMQSFPC